MCKVIDTKEGTHMGNILKLISRMRSMCVYYIVERISNGNYNIFYNFQICFCSRAEILASWRLEEVLLFRECGFRNTYRFVTVGIKPWFAVSQQAKKAILLIFIHLSTFELFSDAMYTCICNFILQF